MLKLPEKPSQEQLNTVCLLTIRETFEDSAENLRDLAPYGNGGWQATYSADGVDYNVNYEPSEGFTKWVKGGGQDG